MPYTDALKSGVADAGRKLNWGNWHSNTAQQFKYLKQSFATNHY